jgi:hypothetical protein
MKAKRPAPASASGKRRRIKRQPTRGTQRRSTREAPPPRRRPVKEQRPLRSGPQTNPIPRPVDKPVRAKNTSQAKARAKARKAKAPKVVRPPLRERIALRLAAIDLNPRALAAKVPFVVLVIGALGLGLGITLWLSTRAAERSYQLGAAKNTNQALLQQKEALERDVLEAQAAPALAESARQLGMIPSRDTAHLVQDPAGNWLVVGTPKRAEGVPPPPLNVPLPEETPTPQPPPPPPGPAVVDPREVTARAPVAQPLAGAPAAPQAPQALPQPLQVATPVEPPVEHLVGPPVQVVAPQPGVPTLPGPVAQIPGPAIVGGLPGQLPALVPAQPPALQAPEPPGPPAAGQAVPVPPLVSGPLG